MTWQAHLGGPVRMLGRVAAALALIAVASWAALFLLPMSVLSVGLIVLSVLALLGAALAGLLFVSASTMRYRLGADALEVTWLSHRAIVPYASIDGVLAGSRLGPVGGTAYVSAADCRIGEARDPSGKPVYFFTTTREEAALSVITTDAGAFVLSPVSSPAFRRELIARLDASDGQQAATPLSLPAWPLQPLRDPLLLATFGTALVILLVVLGVLFDQYPSLPEMMSLQFDPKGQSTALVPRSHVYTLPGIGAASLLANGVIGYGLAGREPALARMLWLASPLVQALVLVSLVRVLQ